MDIAPSPALPAASSTNVPEYTVSEISGAVKRTLEGAFGRVRVRGEITDYKRYPSGHMYFSLKDEGGKISGVVWKSAVSKLGLVPENGIEIIATGRVSAYGDRSSYQLVVERMEYAGAGALLARIEMLRARLAGEGLFDAGRKRHIPLLPAVVGVVTSAAGAVLHDIRTTIARRFPRPVLVWPVPVQGEGAGERIAAAIAGFDAIAAGGPVARPDVLIIARGGGSLEDLMAFNEEAVVRAAALCRIPLISAVGHETDHTLIDLAADRRAPTPTAAAELAVPSRAELVATVAAETARLAGAFGRHTQERRHRLAAAAAALPDLPNTLGTARQRVEDRAQRLGLALPNLLAARHAALVRSERGLPDLPGLLRAARADTRSRADRLLLALPNLLARRRGVFGPLRLPSVPPVLPAGAARVRVLAADLGAALGGATARHRAAEARVAARLSPGVLRSGLREARTRLEAASARLEGASHRGTLARGYALVRDGAGHTVTAAADVRPGQRLRLTFADGDKAVTAEGYAKPVQTALPL